MLELISVDGCNRGCPPYRGIDQSAAFHFAEEATTLKYHHRHQRNAGKPSARPVDPMFPHSRRVIQLGLRGDTLAAFRGPAFGEGGIQDVTPFTKATHARHQAQGEGGGALLLPAEELYPVGNAQVAQRIGID